MGRGGKYSIHIKVTTSIAELFLSVLKSCPAFPYNNSTSNFWILFEAKLIKLGRKQEDTLMRNYQIKAVCWNFVIFWKEGVALKTW